MRIRVIGTAFLAGAALSWTAAADDRPSASSTATRPAPPYVIDQNFDEWVWLPISFSMMEDGRRRLARGDEIGYEHRGPLYHAPKGFDGPAGWMVDGADAYRGRSVLLDARQSSVLVGLHHPYNGIVLPGETYAYEIALRGKGTFHFRAWVGGVDPATGTTQWLGFPDLITVRVTGDWRPYSGTFLVPRLDRPPYKSEARISAAIVIEKGDQIYLDDFRISAVGPRQP